LQVTIPARVSKVTVVSGSRAGAIPVATTVVAVPMMQWPLMGTYSSCSVITTEKSAFGSIAGKT